MASKNNDKYIKEYNWHVITDLDCFATGEERKPNSYGRCKAIIDDSKRALRYAQRVIDDDHRRGNLSDKQRKKERKRLLSHNANLHRIAYAKFPSLKVYKERGY